MKIEYQITVDRIENMIQEQFALFPIEQTKPIEMSAGLLSLEHIELGATRLRGHFGRPQRLAFNTANGQAQYVTRKLRFEQDVMAHLTPAPVKGARNKSKAAEVTLETPLPLVLELDVSMELHAIAQPGGGSASQLHLAPSAVIAIELVGIVGMPTIDSYELPSYRTVIPLDIGTLSALLGATAPVTGAAIVASRQHPFVAVRIQLGNLTHEEETHWSSFLDGEVTPRLFGRSWAMFVDREMPIEPAVEAVMPPESEAAFLDGVNLLWRSALTQAGSAALLWLTRGEYRMQSLQTPIDPLSAWRVELSASAQQWLPGFNDRQSVLVMRLS